MRRSTVLTSLAAVAFLALPLQRTGAEATSEQQPAATRPAPAPQQRESLEVRRTAGQTKARVHSRHS